MSIVILGAGKIGSYVASTLSSEGFSVVIIDKDEKAIQRVERESDVATILGIAPNLKLFEELIQQKPKLFFAATADDETNIVSCTIAKTLGIPKTVCRLQSKEYLTQTKVNFSSIFQIDYFISPEVLAAEDLCKILIHSSDLAVEHFAHGAIHMRTIEIPKIWEKGGTPIRQLSLPNDLIAGLIRRKTEAGEKILIPHGNDHILPGDHLTVVGEAKSMNDLDHIFKSQSTNIKSVIIVGGSSTSVHLATFLLANKIKVRLIDKDLARCESLASLLPQATIINRDGRDPQLLRSERVQDVDAFVSCTHFDETNLMIAALAKEIGSPKAIAQMTSHQITPILEKVGVLPAFSPRVGVANRILTILDEETTLSVKSLNQDTIKIVELKVPSLSKISGIPLSELNLPKGLLIAAIERKGNVVIGRGNHVLEPDDIVIAICNPIQIPKLQELFH